ncbi:hypothetical protein K437DRAFT_253509 [Tilletiaria anomala UBC 951]|uniref:UBX domain-containing protein n=1 Tax=Tilletiaria anomala (strain ATCC 24038 / CBS 436.72 / UBC 951) TaxID=1037660 RepID=A0A066WQ94_TILAU|nr:uncharacterized protein K437DRAFT_253509 [Tilletiaria anomala UBC 951]KDN53179.1 hypothetical protein K437DRAFT_253509 [Tilletiaria anomala UBC 951]
MINSISNEQGALPSPPTEEPKATPAELKAAFADHIQMRHGPDAPLMTKAMREKAEAMLGKQKRTWEYVKIRVRFSDRTQIESSFPSSASINEVYTFVRGAVRQDVLDNKKGGFTLYTAPPCKDYVESDAKIRGKGLVELGLAPAAVLNVRWEDTAMNSNAYPAPLKAELLCSAADLPPPKPFDRPLGHSSDAAGGSGSAANSGKATGQRDPKALPKWLKGFSKK